MIALTSTIGKLYHLILAKRTAEYLTMNNLIDSTLQKAFIPSINGCIEHNICMEEVIKHAKSNRRTVHITFFDLEDAFGKVPHNLIAHSFERNHFPPQISKYVK